MADGYFERGEVYKVRMDYGIGCEEGAFRPGVIISSNRINNTSNVILVAYISRKSAGRPRMATDIEIMATGITSYVMCNQIAGVDKNRLMGYMGKLDYSEQKAVDNALEEIIDLGYADEAALKEKDSIIADKETEIGDLKAEMAGVAAEIAKRDEEIASLKMEIEMWQKCYGRCMDMLVETKVAADVSRRVVVEDPVVKVEPVVSVEPVKLPEPPVEQPEPPVAEVKLDINSCTATALKKIGFSLALARKIVEGRPYTSVEDLKRINGLKATQYRIMESKLCCIPVKVEEPVVVEESEPVAEERDPGFEKLNLNTVSAKELSEVTGIALTQAYAITAYRKKNGPYSCIDDLLKVRNIFPGTIKKFRHMVEV